MEEVIGKKSVKKNYIYNLIYQIFLVIVPLVVTPYVSRVLSPSGIGQYSYSYSLITYFTIFGALGFGYYAQREIAKYHSDKYMQSKIFWEVNICRSFSVLISLIVNIIFCFCGLYGSYEMLMLLFSINIIATGFDIAFFFQGNEEFGRIVIRNIVIKILSIVAIFVFVKKSDDVWIYALINSIMLIISNISLWSYLPKFLVKVKIKEIKPFNHLKGTLRLFIPTVATTIYTVLDKTLLGLLVDGTYTTIENGVEVVKKYSDLENGYYEQSEKLVKMAMTVITCIGTVMIPRNSKEFAEGNYEKVRSNILISSRIVWMVGLPMVFGLIGIASNLVPWFYGEGYDKCVLLISVLSPLIIIIGFSNVFGLQYLLPSGNDSKFGLALVIGSITNVIMNLIFIPFLWSIGAAIGTIIAETIVTISMCLMIKENISIKNILISSWKYLLSSIIMFVIVFFTSSKLSSSIINSLILMFIGAITYVIFLFLLRDSLLLTSLNNIKKILFKNVRK